MALSPDDDKGLPRSRSTSEIEIDHDRPTQTTHALPRHTSPPEAQSMPERTPVEGTVLASDPSNKSLGSAGFKKESVMDNKVFGDHYNYNLAEGAAFSGGNPIGLATAVGRDIGNMVWGSLGFGPKPENHPEMCSQGACSIRKANLRSQAQKIAEEEGRARHQQQRQRQGQGDEKHDDAALGSSPGQRPETIEESRDEQSTPKGAHESDEEMYGESPDTSVKGELQDASMHAPDINRDSVSSEASGDITVSGSGHYNPKNDVILRLETMSSNETRFALAVQWVWLTITSAMLIYNFSEKLIDDNGALKNYKQAKINIGFGTFSLAAITLVSATHAFRIAYNIKQGKVWKPRRRRVVILTAAELANMWVNLFFFILPNYEMLGPRCPVFISSNHIAYYSMIRWLCWNNFFLLSLIQAHNTNIVSVKKTGLSDKSMDGAQPEKKGTMRKSNDVSYKDAIVTDLPFWQCHWWKFVLWFAMLCTVVVCCVYYASNVRHEHARGRTFTLDCGETVEFFCGASNTELGLVSIMVFFALLYFALYCYYIWRSFAMLKTRSATEFRIANMIVRLQIRLRLPAFALFTLSMVLLWYTKPFTCTSFFDTWMGLLPGQMAAGLCVLLTMFVTTPKLIWDNERPPVLQVWLQEFAWTNEEKPRKLARRNNTTAEADKAEIEKEPMFCMETMMNCLYWSLLIYDFDEVEDSTLSLDEACALFRPPLHQYEMFWEKSLDTKMLMAWSRKKIVISFRGTASLANVLADIQAWRTPHYPKRGNWFSRPRIHTGFDKAWRNNKLNEKVLAKVEELVTTGQIDKEDLEFVVTGHSLGGALSTLCAYDVRRLARSKGCDPKVTCVTFGAPRVGNHAFRKEFEEMVPDCWHIINDQDIVARGGKMLFAYKRAGHRVLINKLGDLIVRPNPMEASMRLVPCSGSVQQHLLTSYMQSLLSVLLAQFSRKRLTGGMTGVVALAQNSVPIKRLLMDEAGLSLKDLIHLSRWGSYATRASEVSKLPITGRKSGAVRRDMNSQNTDDSKAMTTRGGFFCGCCAPIGVKIRSIKSQTEGTEGEEDANIRDGGDTSVTGAGLKSPEHQ